MTTPVTRDTAAPGAPADPPTSRLRTELRSFFELFALTGFALAQPLFDVAGRSPDLFVFRRAGRADILILVVLVVFAVPAVLWLGEWLIGLVSQAARRAVHLAMVAGLLLLIALGVLKRLTEVRGWPLLLLALACGLALAVVVARSAAARLWLRYATPAPLVFALVFVTVSPVSQLVLPGAEGSAQPQVVVPPGARAPVVVVFFDEFPMESLLDSRGRIDQRLYPNLARFAGDATWYRNATGIGPFTPYAVPAMLTGRYPDRSVAPSYTEYPDNLFTMLAGSYRVQAWETVTQLCPPSVCTASGGAQAGTGWPALAVDSAKVWEQIVSPRHSDDENPADQFSEATVGERQRAGGQQTKKPGPTFRFDQLKVNQPARFADFLDQLRPSDQPTLRLLHVLLPHQPWKYLPSGRQYPYPPINFGYDRKLGWTTQPAPVQLARQRHLLQLAYTDRLVGEIVQRLKSQGLYDESLVLFTADHGISFTPGKAARTLQKGNAHELMWVPLLIKTPRQRSRAVSDRNVEQVDLLPSIADVLKVKVPWRVDGVSIFGPERDRRTKLFFNQPGRPLTVDGPSNQAVALRGVTDRFARPQDGVDGLFEVGPFSGLIGRQARAVGVAQGSALVARLNDPENLQKVDPEGGTVPALISGALTRGPPGGGPVQLAVAVNGRVGAVGATFTQGETRQTFAMMVPESLFLPGANEVGLYRVAGTGAAARLHPVTVANG